MHLHLRASELVSLPLAAVQCATDTIIVRGKSSKERMVPIGEMAKIAVERWLVHRAKMPSASRSGLAGPSSDLNQSSATKCVYPERNATMGNRVPRQRHQAVQELSDRLRRRRADSAADQVRRASRRRLRPGLAHCACRSAALPESPQDGAARAGCHDSQYRSETEVVVLGRCTAL